MKMVLNKKQKTSLKEINKNLNLWDIPYTKSEKAKLKVKLQMFHGAWKI